MEIRLRPIGHVETEHSDEEVAMAWPQGVEGRIIIYPEYSDGLLGLEGFSHVIVVAWLHKVPESARMTLRIKFRRLVMMGLSPDEIPEVGVFCSDSPHRPNPIALTILRLERIAGNVLHVSDLDLYNGTPVLDLRAYTPSYSIKDYALPSWYAELLKKLRRMGLDRNEL